MKSYENRNHLAPPARGHGKAVAKGNAASVPRIKKM
jgi:hypothetical protein